MSTGSTGNGLADATAYTARTTTFIPLDQVTSAHLNAMQDGSVALNTAISATRAATLPHRTSTLNQADSPAPNLSGGLVVEVEALSAGTTVVVIDTSIDWRDRFVMTMGALLPYGLYLQLQPGGALDNTFDGSTAITDGINHYWYSEQGHTGTSANPGLELTPASYADKWRLFARSTDGALCMVKSANADAEVGFIGRVWAGPQQNHY